MIFRSATFRHSAILLVAIVVIGRTPSLYAAEDGGKMVFAIIPAGSCGMGLKPRKLVGAAKNLNFIEKDEPYRKAKITRSFLIKDTEVTWSQWKHVLSRADKFGYRDIGSGRNGYKGGDDGSHPVTDVSWWDAVKWCNLLSEIENRDPCYYSGKSHDDASVLRAGGGRDAIHVDWNANGYRLPTEAEWEYAWNFAGQARGFTEPDGWHQDQSEGNTHPVGSRPSATSKKLNDMLGNVAEWCWDWKGPAKLGLETDPRGPKTGTHRVFRGGSWADHWMCCRGPYRGDFSPATPRSVFIGFRPIRIAGK